MGGEAEAGGQEGPAVSRIQTFLRLRPVTRPSGRVLASPEEGWVEFNVPRDAREGLINNSRENYRFPFDGLLPPDAGQEEVFDRVALPVLRAALDGYNGTVFAFGQTGSGKTFTITGGPERYADRGLIPRAVSAIFAEAARRGDHTYTLHVSYMEIYNEMGYDLLEPAREVAALEDLPRVSIQEDEEGRMHTRNLSMHRCDTEEQALNMLFLGDTNRVVAETPLNQASSRSHCVFTLHLEARRPGEPLVRRSKLHFVDLAGSERVGKTGLAGHAQLREAKYINLSLHFLEQVIICLQEGRPHVPYRNSVLTQVLRDSLGGNTRTVMVAAVAPEAQHVEESIATCRFAQRVAMISNKVEVNEELDLEVVIKRLKQENALLRQELQLLRSGGTSTGGSGNGGLGEAEGAVEVAAAVADGGLALTEAEQHQLRRQVQAFVENPSPDAALNLEASMRVIHAAFGLLRSMARGTAAGSDSATGSGEVAATELRSLRVLVQQQEQQIAVLAGVLRKQATAEGGTQSGSCAPAPLILPSPTATSRTSHSHSSGSAAGGGWRQQQSSLPPLSKAPVVPYSDDLLADQHKAFEFFCATSPAHDAVAEHKAALRGRCEAARTLGAQVATAKQRIGQLKGAVEQRRLARSMEALLAAQQGGGEAVAPVGASEEEERAKAQIEQEKAAYRGAYEQLKGVKTEIDGMQAALDRGRARLQADFQAWYTAMTGAAAGGRGGSASAGMQQQPQQQEPGLREPSPAAATADRLQGKAHPGMLDVQQQQQQQQQQDWVIPAAGARPVSRGGSSGGAAGVLGAAAALPSFASWEAVQSSFCFGMTKDGTSGSSAATPRGGFAAAPQAGGPHQPWPPAAAAPAMQQEAAPIPEPPRPPPEEVHPYADVDAEVLAAAQPLLTGNPAADADIIKFYQARAALLRGMR